MLNCCFADGLDFYPKRVISMSLLYLNTDDDDDDDDDGKRCLLKKEKKQR